MRIVRRGLAIAIAQVTVIGLVAAGPVDPAVAHQHATEAAARGTELATAKRYGEGAAQYAIAVDALESAGVVHDGDLDDPETKLAVKYYFAWAELERYSGNCACAVALYRDIARRFGAASDTLQTSTAEASARCSAAEPNRASCHNVVAPVPAQLVLTQQLPPRAEPVVWYRDGLGGALAISGLAAAIGGVLFVHAAVQDADAARVPMITYDDYANLATGARRDRILGIGTLALGAVLGTLAGWRYHAVAGQVIASDHGVALQGRF
jgi:hypothetical protein